MKSKKPKPFSKLTPAQQRVEVAKDVIEQLKAEKYIPAHFCYVSIRTPYEDSDIKSIFNQKALTHSDLTCRVCAKGAMFLSIVRKDNGFELPSPAMDVKYLPLESRSLDLFTKEQFDLIETCYEGYGPRGREYFDYYKTSSECLTVICENIIKNEGNIQAMKPSELLDKPEKWCQGHDALDINKKAVGFADSNAVCWCIYTALSRCGLDALLLSRELKQVIGLQPHQLLSTWNDAPERTFEEVRAKLLKAGL